MLVTFWESCREIHKIICANSFPVCYDDRQQRVDLLQIVECMPRGVALKLRYVLWMNASGLEPKAAPEVGEVCE